MADRIKKGSGTTLFKGATKEQVQIPGVNVGVIPQENATYGKDPKIDNIIASQYLDKKDKLTETYVDKIGMETGIYADIQNIDSQILDSYKILGMPDNDIFSNPNLSAEEKVALSSERRNTSSNRISQLRKIQQAKQGEIKELAEFEASKAKAQQDAYKEAIAYQKTLLDQQKFGLEEKKFNLSVGKENVDLQFKNKAAELAEKKFDLDVDKFTASEVKDSDLITGDFGSLDVGQQYGNWDVTQTYGTGSIMPSDNVKLVNGKVGTPGIDLAGKLGDRVAAFEGGKIVSVTSGESNIPQEQWEKTGGSYGNQVVVEDNRGQLHYYNHLDSVGNYSEGQAIQKGQLLGTMGNTGTSTGVHLDYRVKSDRGWEDPRTYISKKGDDKDSNLAFDNSFDYLNSTIPNVAKKISTQTAENIIISDMQSFDMPSSKIKQLKDLGKISSDLVDDYTSIAYANKVWSTLSDDKIVEELKGIDFADMNEEEKLSELVELALAGKLKDGDDELFEGGWLDFDEPGYEAIVDYFDDVHDSIKQANEIALQIKEKYNLK